MDSEMEAWEVRAAWEDLPAWLRPARVHEVRARGGLRRTRLRQDQPPSQWEPQLSLGQSKSY